MKKINNDQQQKENREFIESIAIAFVYCLAFWMMVFWYA